MRPLCRFYASDFITIKYPMKLYNVPVKHKSSTLRNFCDCQLFSAYAFNFRGREILDLWIMSGWYMYNWESIKEVISKIARSQKVDDNIPAPLRTSQKPKSLDPCHWCSKRKSWQIISLVLLMKVAPESNFGDACRWIFYAKCRPGTYSSTNSGDRVFADKIKESLA